MAVKRVLIDDITGEESEDIQTVRFVVQGVETEIDLTKENREKFYSLIAPYANAGRPVQRVQKAKSDAPYDSAAVREWAISEGLDVNPRGRIKNEIVEAYLREHPNN